MSIRTIFSRIGSAVAPGPAQPAGLHRPPGAASAPALRDVETVRDVFYPPQDPGLPIAEPVALLEAVRPTVDRLRELTVSERALFETAYLQPIQNLARLVHLLPASAHEHYSGSAGLFRLCVDLAFYALQSADGKIFTPTGTVEQRHKNEPRWRYATFLAALSCQIYRSLTLMTVTNDKGEEWPRFTTTLYDWLVETGSQRYFVKWHEPSNVTGAEGAAVLQQVAPRERMDWLAQGDVQIVRDMHHVAMGASHQSDSIMAKVVGTIVRRVIEVDEATRRSRYGRLTVGMHVEPYILDAIRDAIEAGRWKVNQVGSPVWYGSDGLFIEWPAAHQDVLAQFERIGVVGMPRSSVTLAEILGKAGVVIAAESGLWVREILVPPQEGAERSRRTTALRFVDALAIFGHLPVDHAKWPFGAELVTAELQAGANLAAAAKPDKPPKPAAPTPVPTTHDKAPSEGVGAGAPAAPSAAPVDARPAPAAAAPTAVSQKTEADTPPVDPDTGEIVYADLVRPAARKWMGSSDIAETVGQMIHLHKAHRGEVVKSLPFGVALCVDWIGDQSPTDITKFVKIFEQNRWLGRPPSAKNEAVKVHEIQFDDAIKSALVLSLDGARDIGFAVGGAR